MSRDDADDVSRECVRVIGCGRHLRRDDQVGLLVAQAIANMGAPRTRVETTEAPSAELLDGLSDGDLLILVDAAQAGEALPAGACERIDYTDTPERIAAGCRTNTHTLSVDAALDLARELRMLPSHVWVYAVGAVDFGFGEEMSPAVGNCIEALSRRILADVQGWLAERESARA